MEKTLILNDGKYKKFNNISPKSWQTVSTSVPPSRQFIEEGMSSLSPLLDRRVGELEPQKMTDKRDVLQVGEVGKVFSKSIDLKKYFDIRSMKVEVQQYDG